MKKLLLFLIPIMFTAQACDLLLGSDDGGSGRQGIFVSTDSADSWKPGLPKRENLNLAGAMISRIYIEGARPQNVIAASTNAGLLASDTYGDQWIVLLPGFTAYDAFVNPFNDKEIFVAGSKSRLAAIYKSADRGASWIQVYNEPTGQIAVTVLAFDRSDPRIMYAGLSSGAVLKSGDGGDTWNSLAVFDARVVEISVSQNLLYGLTLAGGLNRSVDGGRTWAKLAFSQSPTYFNDLYLDPANSSDLYVATSLGLYRSEDAGVTWNKLSVPATPEVTDVTAVAVNPGKKNQIFTAIRSTVYRSDDGGRNWRTVQLPTNRTIASIVIDPFEPNRVYVGLK